MAQRRKKKSDVDNRRSILSTRSESVLGYRLTSELQIWVGYIIPAVVNCAVYIADVCTSVALAERHFEERNFGAGSVTVALIFTPPVVFCGYSIYKRNYWKIHTSTRERTLFVLLRILNIIAFPAWIIYRYAKQIFWSIEALFQRGHGREEALHFARKPSWIYFHLFLQAFLQSAPQAYFQLCILLKQYENNYQTDVMHVACILSSLTMLAITVASFQRFESQKIIGRQLPWALKYWTASDLEKGEQDGGRLSCLVEYDKRMDKTHDFHRRGDEVPEETGATKAAKDHPDAPQLGTREVVGDEKISGCETDSDSNSTPYLKPKNLHDANRSDLDSTGEDDELNLNATGRILNQESSGSRVTHGGGQTDGNESEVLDSQTGNCEPGSTETSEEPDGAVVTVRGPAGSRSAENFNAEGKTKLTVPLTEAPPIPATNNPPEKDFPSAEHLNSGSKTRLTVPLTEAPPILVINNPPDEPENDLSVIKRRVSETSDEIRKVKGIDLDEPVGKVIAFLWWFLFLVSRMTAMAVAFQMNHFLAFGICLFQYAATLGILTYLDRSSTKRILINFFLSYVYLYALVEYKMRLKRPFLSNVVFFLVLSVEDVAICTTWYFTTEVVDWWETYVFVLTCGSLGLSLFSFLTYFAILKPKSVIVRPPTVSV